MSLQVFTSRISCCDPDRLDVTRKSGETGLFLAPSWRILKPALEARKEVDALMQDALSARERDPRIIQAGQDEWNFARAAEALAESSWERYRDDYLHEMRQSYRRWRPLWNELLARPRVVLCCYCTDHEHCHRWILRTMILPTLGAEDRGELSTEK